MEIQKSIAEKSSAVNKPVLYLVVMPIAWVGIVLNCLLIYAWNKSPSTFKRTIFLSKALAVAEITFVGTFCLWFMVPTDTVIHDILFNITFTAQEVVVNITLILVVFRWISIKFLHVPQVLRTRFSVNLSLGIVIGCCVLARLFRIIITYGTVSTTTRKITLTFFDQILVSATVLALFVMSITLLFKDVKFSPKKTKSQSGHELGQQRQIRQQRRNHALTNATACIGILTFVVYPFVNTFRTYFRFVRTKPEFTRIIFTYSSVATVLNSSINPLIFLYFIRRFRRSLKKLFCGVQKSKSTPARFAASQLSVAGSSISVSAIDYDPMFNKGALKARDNSACLITMSELTMFTSQGFKKNTLTTMTAQTDSGPATLTSQTDSGPMASQAALTPQTDSDPIATQTALTSPTDSGPMATQATLTSQTDSDPMATQATLTSSVDCERLSTQDQKGTEGDSGSAASIKDNSGGVYSLSISDPLHLMSADGN